VRIAKRFRKVNEVIALHLCNKKPETRNLKSNEGDKERGDKEKIMSDGECLRIIY